MSRKSDFAAGRTDFGSLFSTFVVLWTQQR
jgi:hypothetical protein